MTTITVKAVKCIDCECLIFSRARYDYRRCICKNTSVDGGFNWIKVFGNAEKDQNNNIIFHKIKIQASIQDLYFDWHNNKNKFGLIKAENEYDDSKDHEKCQDCKGTGFYIGFTIKSLCFTCDGSGFI